VDAVGICNLALGWLGATAITQLNAADPLSTEEELCSRLYPAAVRSVLEAKPWTWATKREALGPAEATGLPDFPSKYPLPSTVVRVLSCDDGGGANDIEYRREGGYLLTETSPATLFAKVITLEEDPTRFSTGFARAVAARLAADLAMPLTENAGVAKRWEAQYAMELQKAGALDGAQGRSEGSRPSICAARRW